MDPKARRTTAVIIPVYNVEEYLPRCMKTVLNQSVPFDEIILVDDGSTDNSGRLCDNYSQSYDNIKAIHKVNGGLSSARNAGIEATSCDYVSFIDSDDWVASNYLEALFNIVIEQDADIAMCGMKRTSEYREEDVVSSKLSDNCFVYSQDDFMRIMMRINGNRTVHYACGKLFRRSLLDNNHFPVGLLNEDVESCFKAILRAGTIAETADRLYFYYYNENSITGAKFGENYLNLNEVWERVCILSSREAPQWYGAAKLNLMRADFTILCDSIIHGDKATDETYKEQLMLRQRSLRKNLRALLFSPIAFNRKILIVLMSYFYKPICSIVRMLVLR